MQPFNHKITHTNLFIVNKITKFITGKGERGEFSNNKTNMTNNKADTK